MTARRHMTAGAAASSEQGREAARRKSLIKRIERSKSHAKPCDPHLVPRDPERDSQPYILYDEREQPKGPGP